MKKKDVLSAEMNFNVGYKPKTRETKAAYEVLLKSMTEQFGEQPSDVLRGAAEATRPSPGCFCQRVHTRRLLGMCGTSSRGTLLRRR